MSKDPWINIPSLESALALLLRLALNGSLENPLQHITPMSDQEKKAVYDVLASSPKLGFKTGFPMVFLSETGLPMFHLTVDSLISLLIIPIKF